MIQKWSNIKWSNRCKNYFAKIKQKFLSWKFLSDGVLQLLAKELLHLFDIALFLFHFDGDFPSTPGVSNTVLMKGRIWQNFEKLWSRGPHVRNRCPIFIIKIWWKAKKKKVFAYADVLFSLPLARSKSKRSSGCFTIGVQISVSARGPHFVH